MSEDPMTALDAAREAMDDPSAPLQRRLDAVWVLGSYGHSDDVERLVSAVTGSPEATLRTAAATALGRRKDGSASKALAAAVVDKASHVRLAAVWALGEIGDRNTLPALVRALGDADLSVRSTAAHALGQLGDQRGVQHIATHALRDPERAVRLAAVQALERLGQVGPIRDLLKDQEWGIRLHAVEALGKARSVAAVPGLIERLATDPHPLVRARAAWALGEIRDERAVAPLRTAAEARGGWLPRSAAASALQQFHRPPPALTRAFGRIADAFPTPFRGDGPKRSR